MATKVKAIPEGAQAVTPYLSIKGAASAIEFYKKAFGAKELMRVDGPGGAVGHAEISIGGPKSIGGTPVHLHLYVQDVDAAFAQAVKAGAKVLRPVADQFYGDRSGSLEDPFGHVWHLATHKEDLSPQEIERRAAAQKK
jgi:PhnB protein